MAAATEKRNTLIRDGETKGSTCFVNTKPNPQMTVTEASNKYKNKFLRFCTFLPSPTGYLAKERKENYNRL